MCPTFLLWHINHFFHLTKPLISFLWSRLNTIKTWQWLKKIQYVPLISQYGRNKINTGKHSFLPQEFHHDSLLSVHLYRHISKQRRSMTNEQMRKYQDLFLKSIKEAKITSENKCVLSLFPLKLFHIIFYFIYSFFATGKYWIQVLNYSNPILAINNWNGRGSIREGKRKVMTMEGKKINKYSIFYGKKKR